MGKDKRMTLPNKKKLRNLVQYKDLTDEEFEEVWEEMVEEIELSPEELERRVEEKLEELGVDYDMADMKINDMAQLRSLALAQIQLDDLEEVAWRYRQKTSYESVQILDKINRILSSLRDDISKISADLQLTRKIRKQSKESSVIDAIEDLRSKAHKFYKQRMLYVFCPECKMLLATLWLMYADEESNELHVKCVRCGHKLVQPLAPLYDSENKNLEDVLIP
jgi:Zn ribbon nucleic-acid-binding protein